jgi:RNA polymerase sigma-70 factor (ECF subfamily)
MDAKSPLDDHASATNSRELLQRLRGGDPTAAERLFSRYLPQLHRWGHRRLPQWARGIVETSDVVHDVVLQAFRHLDSFEPQRDGALLGYLRRSLLNRIRDQFRVAVRRPAALPLDHELPDATNSPLDLAVNTQNREHYVAALKRLRPEDRHAIIARLELGYSYEQLAVVLQKRTAEAARLAVRRALLRLAHELEHV